MLVPCGACGAPLLRPGACPSCGRTVAPRFSAAFLALGLVATGCGAAPDTGIDADYGVATVDEDADGYDEDEDCDDADPEVNPGAEELPGDGLDSNCDGEDDT